MKININTVYVNYKGRTFIYNVVPDSFGYKNTSLLEDVIFKEFNSGKFQYYFREQRCKSKDTFCDFNFDKGTVIINL